jgi:hypothetical protein
MKTSRGVFPVLAAVALAMAACGGPYKGKPQKLPKGPKQVPPPADADVAVVVEVKWVEECTFKPTDDPMKAKKSASKAKPFNEQGGDFLVAATNATDPQLQVNNVLQAIEVYKKALLEDNYNPEATFGLAVAYAKVQYKGCALKLLKRLGELNTNPKLAGGQTNLDAWLDQVEDETAFRLFKNDAMQAIGR